MVSCTLSEATLTLQRTLKREVSFSGKALFSGGESQVRLIPAPPHTGLVFKRGSILIPALVDYVIPQARCTTLQKEGVTLQTVEHLLAAIRSLGLNNLVIDVSGEEIPIFDGSASSFVSLLEEAGFAEEEEEVPVYGLKNPVFWSRGDIHMVALPSDEYRVSYTLHYPQSRFIGSQYCSFRVTPEGFKEEVAFCRTFTLYEEILPFIQQGLFKNAGLDNGILIREDKVVNPEGLRHPEELVRHKILDTIGDLALTGKVFKAHVIGIKSGHSANHELARLLKEELVQL